MHRDFYRLVLLPLNSGPRKKRTFFLMEIAIGLSLAGILLAILFQFTVSNTKFAQKTQNIQAILFDQQRLRERLDSLFLSIYPPIKGSSLYTVQFPNEPHISLIALFDAGVDPDPAFSGPNRARLFIDQNHNLCFTQWPIEHETHRTEILLKDIRSVEWEFLGHIANREHATRICGDWAWLKKWEEARMGVPPIIRLKLWQGIDKKKQKEPNLYFAFILPQQEPIQIIKES